MRKTILCFLETLIINLIIYYLFYYIQNNQGVYLELNPHPLFILTIIMALRYGNYRGVLSATICSIFYIIVFIKLNGSFTALLLYFDNYKYILLFFASATVIGTFKDNYTANINKLKDENTLIKNDYNNLDKAFNTTHKLLEEFKKQIINSEESILNLYEIASRLGTFNIEEIYTETIGILSKYLSASAISIYTYDKRSGYLRLKIRIGDDITEKKSLLVNDSEGFNKVVSEMTAVRWTDVKENEFPLMSAPIIKNGEAIAIVNIEDMGFDKISEYAFQLFKLIIEWVNKSLKQASFVGELNSSRYYKGTNIMHYDAFTERLISEKRRRDEFEMEFIQLTYEINNINIDTINNKLKKTLRTVDVMGLNNKGNILYVLLPATPLDMSYIVNERILKNLDYKVKKLDVHK